MGRHVLALIFLAVAGCADARAIRLDARWAPLAWVVEDDSLPDGYGFTHGRDVAVKRLAVFTSMSPKNQEAWLAHEQVHARNQFALGLALWERRYESDPGFRLAEEKLGYAVAIQILADRDGPVHGDSGPLFARSMSSSIYGGMVGYDEALAWCEAQYLDALR